MLGDGRNVETEPGSAGLGHDEFPIVITDLDSLYLLRYKGKLPLAIFHYEKSLIQNLNNTRVRYKKGYLFILSNRHTEAIKEFQEVLKKDPDYALAYEGLGHAFFLKKDYKKAEKMLLKSL